MIMNEERLLVDLDREEKETKSPTKIFSTSPPDEGDPDEDPVLLTPPQTPTKKRTTEAKKVFRNKSPHRRRFSYLVEDIQEVSSPKRPAEILVRKKPINGWGFSRWCFMSIATGRVIDREGLTPILLYGRQNMTPTKNAADDERKSRRNNRTCFSHLRRSTRNASSLHILTTSPTDCESSPTSPIPADRATVRTIDDEDDDDITEKELRSEATKTSEIELITRSVSITPSRLEAKGSPVSASSLPGRGFRGAKKIDDLSDGDMSPMSCFDVGDEKKQGGAREETFEEISETTTGTALCTSESGRCSPRNIYVTPRKPSITLDSELPSSPLSITTKAHRKWSIIASPESELNEMLRLVRRRDTSHLFIRVENASEQIRCVHVEFKTVNDAIHFFERAREAVVHSNVRNLCDAVIMNDPAIVSAFTGFREESRELAANIVRKDRRQHSALEYARHYNDEVMVQKLEASASVHCIALAARTALAAAKSACTQAMFARRVIIGGGSVGKIQLPRDGVEIRGILEVDRHPKRCFCAIS